MGVIGRIMTEEQLEDEIKRLQEEIEMYQSEIENFSQLAITYRIGDETVRDMKNTYDQVIEKTLVKLNSCLEKREYLLTLQVKKLSKE